MSNPYENEGFAVVDEGQSDISIYRHGTVMLIAMARFKNDKKAFRTAANHIDDELIRSLIGAFGKIRSDPTVTSVILTSLHRVVFSRGAKIEILDGATVAQCRSFIEYAQKLVLEIQSLQVPVIAALNGLTFGGGLEIALACDYRVASNRQNVIFGFPEVSLGIVPGMGGTQNLMRLVGKEKAIDIIGEARIDMTPDEADDLGIVDRVVEPNALIGEALSLAQDTTISKRVPDLSKPAGRSWQEVYKEFGQFLEKGIEKLAEKNEDFGRCAPLAWMLADQICSVSGEDRYLEGLLLEREAICRLLETDDCHEGLRALIEERAPLFKGH